MNGRQVMKALRAAGTAQNRKIYARHGIQEPMFGVSSANLTKIRKDILRIPGPRPRYEKHAHELVEGLWDSGNHDARILATMLADPQQIRSGQLDLWMRECNDRGAEWALVNLTAATPFAESKMKKWRKSGREFTATAGWNLLVEIAQSADDRPDSFFVPYLQEIRDGIHASKNRARYAMNNAVIAIGGRSPNLRRRAIAAAKKIGPVDVDHGDTSCKTPDAVPYIERIWEHKTRKAVGFN